MSNDFATPEDLFDDAKVPELIDLVASTAQGVADEGRAGFHAATRKPVEPARRQPTRAPDIEFCAYDAHRRVFVVFFMDGSSARLAEERLELDEGARVVACRVDEFRRGVVVDYFRVDAQAERPVAGTTDFSGDVALYDSDPEFRERVDQASKERAKGKPDAGRLFASKVRHAREELGWTAAELARRAGIAPPNINRIESGKHAPSSKTAFLMADVLGQPIGWFYDPDS